VAYAHGQGVVHRDLKPENILVDAAGRLRIADFGLAKLMAGEPGSQALTGTGQILGTAAYMAPEQVIGSPEVDHRADLYTLGVLAYELLTGHLPLGRFEPPSRQPGVDVRLDGVILRALERDPARRWQQAAEFGQALGQANASTQPLSSPAGGGAWGLWPTWRDGSACDGVHDHRGDGFLTFHHR
jgi:serine/threonine protein kinase